MLKHRNKIVRKPLILAVKLLRYFFETITRRSILKIHDNLSVKILEIPGYNSTFAGYYDISPFQPGKKQIAIHATNWPINKVPSRSATVDIFLYDLEKDTTRFLDSTYCWNWQQGARLQWIDNTTLIFNKLINSEIRAVLLNVEDKQQQVLPDNLSIAYKNEYMICLSYQMLSSCSEYGYAVKYKNNQDQTVRRYVFKTREIEHLFDWRELSFLNIRKARKAHINHPWPSPTGNCFVFVYRFWINQKRFDSLVLYDFETKKNKILVRNQTIGHYTWKNDKMLLLWAILDGVEGYFTLRTTTNEIRKVSNLTDGHPNFIHENVFIADIAPSFRQLPYRTLYALDIVSKRRKDLITLNHPTIFNEACRCDMHPSLSLENNLFQVDTRHLPGKRAVIVGTLPKLI